MWQNNCFLYNQLNHVTLKNEQSEGLKVLIVDDEPDICYLLTGILRKRNLDAQSVHNLSDAQEALQMTRPNLIFLDNRLPDGLGLEFILFIKRNYPGTKVIIMTAYDSISEHKLAFANGADYFINKPLNKDLIHLALSQVA